MERIKVGRIITTYKTGHTSKGLPIPLDEANNLVNNLKKEKEYESKVEQILNPTAEDIDNVKEYMNLYKDAVGMIKKNDMKLQKLNNADALYDLYQSQSNYYDCILQISIHNKEK